MQFTKLHILQIVAVLAISIFSDKILAFEHNIMANYAISPCINCRAPINIPTPVSFEFVNTGTSDETNVKLFVVIKSSLGAIIYRDSVTVLRWQSNHILDTTFKDFTPVFNATFHIVGIAALPSDENRSDDTASTNIYVRYETDVAARAVLEPHADEIKPQGKSFSLSGTFQSIGVTDVYDMPIRVKILNCSNNQLVFQSDTLMPEVYADSAPIKLVFPSKEGIYDIAKLNSGCYLIAMIANLRNDGDRTNDTVYSNFSVVKKYFDHDISANAVISPANNSAQPPDRAIHVQGLFQNIGLNTETNVTLISSIKDKDGNIIYQDTSVQNNWAAGQLRTVLFQDFFPPSGSPFTMKLFAALNGDQASGNDAQSATFNIGNACEVGAISILKPLPGEILPPGAGFIPIGTFRWEGDPAGKVDVPVRIQIRRCADNQLIFQADSTIPKSSFVFGDVQFAFPSRGSAGPLTDLLEGCYQLSVISLLSCDSDPLNDMVQTSFTVGRIPNNISVESIISPPEKFRMLVNSQVPISCRFINQGTADQSSVRVSAFILDPSAVVVYRDTQILSDWTAGKTIDASFKQFTPATFGIYRCYAVSLLTTDGWHGNDTLSQSFMVTKQNDVAALSVASPEPNAIIPEGTEFQPIGLFQTFFGLQDLHDIPVRCQILGCNDTLVVFQSDGVIPVLYLDSSAISFSFPTLQGNYNITSLPTGCYKLEIIADYPSDIDHTNDTAYIPFSVFKTSTVSSDNFPLVSSIMLGQNFPNPFASSTTISYSLPENGRVSIRILDITGRTIRTEIADGAAGEHKLTLDLHDLPSGVYIYELNFTNRNGVTRRLEKLMSVLR